MQNKGAITLLAVLFAIVSLYQLSFTLVTWSVKKDAQEFAKNDKGIVDKVIEARYLDSVASEEVYPLLGFTFRKSQTKEMNLGLDLKGGMNVTLEVRVSDLINSMSGFSKDPTFTAALKKAIAKQTETQDDFLTLFYDAFIAEDKDAQLASVFGTLDLQDRINSGMNNEEVMVVLKEEVKDAIDNSFNVIRTRIDRFGVVQPNIQKLEGATGRILVELPGIKDPKRVRKLLQGTANLEFWETYTNQEIFQYLTAANTKLKEMGAGVTSGLQKDTTTLIPDSTENEVIPDSIPNKDNSLLSDTTTLDLQTDSIQNDATEAEGFAEFAKENPLFAVLKPNTTQDNNLVGGPVVGNAHHKDTARVNEYLQMAQIKSLFPRDVKLLWHVKAFDVNENYFQLVAIKVTNRDGRAPLDGGVITNARTETDQTSAQWEVSMTMDADGAKTWAMLTKNNVGREIAIVLDNYVYSFPTVNGEITGGRSSISGNFSVSEADDLANILKSGKLPAPAIIIEEQIVGPSLGAEAVQSGLISFIIAFFVILVYMVFFYKSAGTVADIALIANIFFIFGVLASLGAVLTLPGIAGIVLTIGMSVDANVLIFERIKEELALGKGLKLAVTDGYRHAYSAIIDANITTLITGIILYSFGHGPIKGFATTLIIGILTSLFSAIFITRIIFTKWLDKNKSIDFSTKLTKNAFKNTMVNFIDKRKVSYGVSGLIILIGIGSLFVNGLNEGVDFVGGRTFTVRFDKTVNPQDIRKDLAAVFESEPEVKTFGADNQVKIITKYLIESKSTEADSIVETKLYAGLQKTLGAEVSMQTFLDENRMSSQKVGPTIADDIKTGAYYAIIFSLIGIFLYILLRFRNWQYGLGAVAALFHDVLIVISLFSLLYKFMPFNMEINQAFIAAILTVVGYSVNDTVVVFDRIREFMKERSSGERKTVYNQALNSTLSRTFSTSLSTFFVLLTIFIFGGEVIRGFVFALLIGVVVGTYSSLFIATPVVFDTVKDEEVKVVEGNSKRDYTSKKKKKKTPQA